MKKNIMWITFFLTSIMLSCSNSNQGSVNNNSVPLIIDMDEVSKEYLPPKIKHIRYTPLETTPDCLMGHQNKILIKNDKIYVADFDITMALFVFDMQGKFLFKIARRGKGAGEYIGFHDFDIHHNGDIYMFDPFTKKILIFSPEGYHKEDIIFDYYFKYFCLSGDNIYCSRFQEKGIRFANLAKYNIPTGKMDFLIEPLGRMDYVNANNSSFDFYSSPGIIYYSPKGSEIIYAIDNTGIRPAIGLKNLRFPPESVIENWIKDHRSYFIDSDFYKETVYIYETKQYVFFRSFTGFANEYIYDKLQKKCHLVDIYSVIGTGITGSNGTDFFGVFIPDSENKNDRKILESHKELTGWKEEDNPVIVFFDIEI